MGGDETFSGINYQASVVAYVYVHILTRARLRWLPATDDTPTAISGETRAPGDDARIEFGTTLPAVEVQAMRRVNRPPRSDTRQVKPGRLERPELFWTVHRSPVRVRSDMNPTTQIGIL